MKLKSLLYSLPLLITVVPTCLHDIQASGASSSQAEWNEELVETYYARCIVGVSKALSLDANRSPEHVVHYCSCMTAGVINSVTAYDLKVFSEKTHSIVLAIALRCNKILPTINN